MYYLYHCSDICIYNTRKDCVHKFNVYTKHPILFTTSDSSDCFNLSDAFITFFALSVVNY